MAFQTRMFGESADRTHSWETALMEIMRTEPIISDMTVWHKRCGARLLMQDPKYRDAFGKLFASISTLSKQEFQDTAEEVLLVLLSDTSAPAPDTVARQTRSAKAKLGISDAAFANTELKGKTLDGIFREIEARQASYNSDLEVKLGYALKDQCPLGEWQINERQGELYAEPDIISHVYRLSIEVDSWAFHRHKDQFRRDRAKSRRLQLRGYRHLQFAGEELTVPNGIQQVVAEVKKFTINTLASHADRPLATHQP